MTPDPAPLAELLPPPMPPVWAVLELLGHRRLVGRVSEVELFGRRMGKIEVPRADGTFDVQHFGGASVYALTETTEAKVRAELERQRADAARWAAPALPPAHRGYPEAATRATCSQADCAMLAEPDCDAGRCAACCDQRCDTHCERSVTGAPDAGLDDDDDDRPI